MIAPPENDNLFSPDPLVRLGAAASFTTSKVSQVMPSFKKWIPQAFGVANAWLVVVGPSPGKGPGGKIQHPVEPVLGRILPEFERFADPSTDTSSGFWRELFRLLRQGFRHADLAIHDNDAALKLMMLMNLDATPEGDSTKIPLEKLRAGLPRLNRIIDVTRPRLILALSEEVYKEICQWWNAIGSVGPERKHKKVSKYTPKSRWLISDNGKRILLTKTLQHPSKRNFYLGFETEVSDSLGDLIAEAASQSPTDRDTTFP